MSTITDIEDTDSVQKNWTAAWDQTNDPVTQTALKTNELSKTTLVTDVPNTDLSGREVAPLTIEKMVDELEVYKENPTQNSFPNLTWEALKVGLAKEKYNNDKLNEHIEIAKKHQENIDLLLDLNAEALKLKDDTSEMTEKMKGILDQLKERGIEILDKDQQLTKEKIAEMKSLTSGQIDQQRSKLQIIFTKDIQFLTQEIDNIVNILKDMLRNYTHSGNTFVGNQKTR